MHISYFLNFYTLKGFVKSLLDLPGHNARGLTSKQSHKVPWGDQYRVLSKNEYWICTYDYEDQEYYPEGEEEIEDEDYIIEYLSHQGWVQV